MSELERTPGPGFWGVRGHDEVQHRLRRAIERGQLHHAIILVGPAGVGKATLARALASALHCKTARGIGCDHCDACRRVRSGQHPGVEWIEPESPGGTIKVATARELANRLELAPFEGSAHVVVFDPARALTEQAYNALLKAIEEPRPGVHFVMVTTSLDALLPTILSRCIALRMGRLAPTEVRSILDEAIRTRDDASDVHEARADLAVHLADGSAGLAVELALDPTLDDALALLEAWVQAADAGAAAIFSGDKSPIWARFAAAVGPLKTGRPARERAVAARTTELWLLHLRERLRGRDGLVPESSPPATGVLLHRLDRLQQFLESLERNPNVRLAVETTLLDLSAPTSSR